MRFLSILSTLVLFCCVFVGAQFVIPPYEGYVTDYAGVLSVDQKIELEQKIVSIVDTTSTEIAILLVPTINNDSIAFSATAVGQEWGVGGQDRDTGIVILVAVEDREWFIAVGYGLEGVIPDAIAKRIGERHFPRYFPAGDYAGGLVAVLGDIGGYIAADPAIVTDYAQEEMINTIGLWIFAVIIALIFLVIVWLSKDKKHGSKMLATSVWLLLVIVFAFIVASIAFALLFVSFFGLFFLIKSGSGMSIGGPGRGGMSGGFSGGGFGGFGGGGFGGGGAGGRW